MTPLQGIVHDLIATYERRHGSKLSGRELSSRLGKSRNHLSQIMNDGLVPSGEVLLKLGKVLEANEDQLRDLLLAAMRTKADGRARDSFWLARALELTDTLMDRIEVYESFLDRQGMKADFKRWTQEPADAPPETPPEG